MEFTQYESVRDIERDLEIFVNHVTYKDKRRNYWDAQVHQGQHHFIDITEGGLKKVLKVIQDAKRGKIRIRTN